MSFILDALRKSENARHREVTPGLADVHIVRRESRMPWVLAVIGLLLFINAAVLLALVLRRDTDRSASARHGATAATATTVPAAPRDGGAGAAPAVPPPRAGRPSVRPLSDEATTVPPPYTEPPPLRPAPATDPDAVRAAPLPGHVRRLDVQSDIAAAAQQQQQAAVDAAPGGVRNGGTLPTVNELGAQATAGLPTLSVDLHVYATDPAQRFVIVNGRRYQEGGRMPEGVAIERITPDGVVMNNKGLRFLLPRD